MTIFLVEFQGGLRRALHTELVLKPLILFSVGRTYPWSEIKASHTPLSTNVCVCVCVCAQLLVIHIHNLQGDGWPLTFAVS